MSIVNLAQCIFDRTGLALGEDDAIITNHWRHMVPASPDTVDMDHGDRDTATTALKTMWTALQAYAHAGVKFKAVRWYQVPDAAPHKPVFLEEIAFTPIPGTGGSCAPPQNAVSVTFKTDQRKTWGRFYLPCNSNGIYNTDGTIKNAIVDAINAAVLPLTDRGGVVAKPTLTVWSRVGGTHHDPQFVQVDNNPDIVRRRRFSLTTYKKSVNTP